MWSKVLQYNLRQLETRLAAISKPKQIVGFGDDLGMQTSLPMSPEKWRKYLKPCFARIYQPVRAAGHYVWMHTDGHILGVPLENVEAICAALENCSGYYSRWHSGRSPMKLKSPGSRRWTFHTKNTSA